MDKDRKPKKPAKSAARSSAGRDRQSVEPLSNQPVLEVRRHWFGLASVYVLMGLGLLAIVLIFPVGDGSDQGGNLVAILALAMAVCILLVLSIFIAKVYMGNILLISQMEVKQISREALFLTKSSVLGLANVEDVTTVRKGITAHVFNYGTLNIETAGEQDNFMFRYCPRPEECARTLMELREDYLRRTKQDQFVR